MGNSCLSLVMLLTFGNGVHAPGGERMAAAQALHAEPQTAPGTEPFNRFPHVIRAGRIETAGGRQKRGHSRLIYAQKADQGRTQSCLEHLLNRRSISRSRSANGHSIAARRGLITTDHGWVSCAKRWLTASRNLRRSRLRTTALPMARGTVKPMYGPLRSGWHRQNAAKSELAERVPVS